MKTEEEITRLFDDLNRDPDEIDDDDVPFIENVRAFREALRWVLEG